MYFGQSQEFSKNIPLDTQLKFSNVFYKIFGEIDVV